MLLCGFLSVQPTLNENQRTENGGIGLVSIGLVWAQQEQSIAELLGASLLE